MNRYTRNLESSTLIWLTNKPDETKLNQLRNVIDYVRTFDDVHVCNDYIEQILDQDQIYVITDKPYTSTRAKVYQYQNDENFAQAVDSLQADESTDINALGINIFKQSTHSQLNSEFLWFQRILGVLLDDDDHDKAKKNLLDAYKRYFEGNRRKEEKVQLFENTYRSEDALQWYTKECFFFEVLNKALRTQDIDVLFSLRFFLRDMYNQLKIEYQRTPLKTDLTIYRGQIISPVELQTIRDNVGQLISLNSFISTTHDEEIAKGFSASGDSSVERVFFSD